MQLRLEPVSVSHGIFKLALSWVSWEQDDHMTSRVLGCVKVMALAWCWYTVSHSCLSCGFPPLVFLRSSCGWADGREGLP